MLVIGIVAWGRAEECFDILLLSMSWTNMSQSPQKKMKAGTIEIMYFLLRLASASGAM